jgi:hypothetical protein
MKSSTWILVLWLGASSWAQTLPQKQQVNPPVTAKPNAARTVSPSTLSPKTSASAKQVPAQSYGRGHGGTKKAIRPISAQTTEKKDGMPAAAARGHRDPFVSPIVERIRDSTACAGSGRRCLLVGEISLHGVVRTPSGFIAVVVNGEHTYFLHENDPLADGAVERITKDAIILRERSSDALGRPLTREVTKKIGVPAV